MAWNCHLYFCFFPRGQVMERGAWWLGSRMCAIRCAARIPCERCHANLSRKGSKFQFSTHGHAKTNHINSWSAGMELISVVRSETLVTTFDHIHLQSGLSLLSSHINWVRSSYSLRYVNWSTLKKKAGFNGSEINFCCIFSLVIYHH